MINLTGKLADDIKLLRPFRKEAKQVKAVWGNGGYSASYDSFAEG